MTEPVTKWSPERYCDEVAPEPRDSPDHWITSLEDGAPALAAPNDWDECSPIRLNDGDVVGFVSYTNYGQAELILEADGTHSIDRAMPAEAELVCALWGWQSETLSSTPDEVAKKLRELDATPGDYVLAYYTYSHEQPFVFDAATRSFRRVANA